MFNKNHGIMKKILLVRKQLKRNKIIRKYKIKFIKILLIHKIKLIIKDLVINSKIKIVLLIKQMMKIV